MSQQKRFLKQDFAWWFGWPRKLLLLLFMLLVLIVPLTAEESAHSSTRAHWSYSGKTGTAFWGDLKPEYKMAKIGKEQNPKED